jgi:hypothetical protein
MITMFLTIFSGLQQWLMQVERILWQRFQHLTPAEYTMMLIFCICAGYFLLRGKN